MTKEQQIQSAMKDFARLYFSKTVEELTDEERGSIREFSIAQIQGVRNIFSIHDKAWGELKKIIGTDDAPTTQEGPK